MKTTKILLAVLLIHMLQNSTYCQDIKKLERLDAVKTNGAIYIVEFLSSSKKYVTKETTPIVEASNFETSKLNYFRTANNNITILMPFYNPLQYNLKVYSSYSEDPNTKTYNEFMVAFNKTFESLAPQLNTSSEIDPKMLTALGIPLAQMNKFEYVMTNQKVPIIIQSGVNINSILLRDWVYQLVQKPYLKDSYSLELSDAIEEVENFLLGKVSVSGVKKKSVDDWIKETSNILYNQTNIAGFEKELTKADTILQILQEIEVSASTKKEDVIELVENQPEAKNLDGSADLIFQNYSKVTARYFEITAKPLFDQKREKISQFENFLKKLRNDYTETYKSTEQPFSKLELANVANIAMEDDKDLTITIGLRKIDKDGNKTQDTLGIVFTVIHQNKLNIVPDISAGFVFFSGGLEYKSYSLKDDLISEQIKTKNFQPVVFLNFYSRLFDNFYLVLPQIGVTNATDFPALLIGGGVTLLNRFSFSAGIPISFTQKLKDGKVSGDSIDQGKTLGDYTSFTLNNNFPLYFSLSYRLGKE